MPSLLRRHPPFVAAVVAAALVAVAVAIPALADPAASSSATKLQKQTKKALGLARKADKRTKTLTAQVKKLKKATGPQGPQGVRGATGASGAPGSALAYATISDGTVVDPSRSFRVTTANVTDQGTTLCFNGLGFKPSVAVANASAAAGTTGSVSIRTSTEETSNCPGAEQASVTGVGSSGTEVDPPAFAIAFY